MRNKYRSLLTYVRERSLIVASLLPHLLLIIPVVAFIYFLPDIAASISGGWMVVLVALIWPLKSSLQSLQSEDTPSMSCNVMYWIILAVSLSVSIILNLLPFVGRGLAFIPFKEEISFLFLLWLLLPWTNGVNVFYGMMISFLDRYVKVKHTAALTQDQQNIILRTLRG
jgi:hypothetical protein